MNMTNTANTESSLANFIWKNADDLRDHFPHTDFGKIILPFTVLRRLECVLESTKGKVVETFDRMKNKGLALDTILKSQSDYPFYNTSNYDLSNLGGTKTKANLEDYISKFSDNARIIFEQFDFANTIQKLEKANILLKICNNFADIDLHPNTVPDRTMSNVYEHLILRFGAEVNEGAEDFMTPRDAVHLATSLLFAPDDDLFANEDGFIRKIFDQSAGTGGFISDMMNYVDGFKDRYKIAPVLIPYGQEIQPETHAVCLGNMLLKRIESDPKRDLSQNIALGSSISQDAFPHTKFHYQISNPPYGKKWQSEEGFVKNEHKTKGFEGRYGAGYPKVSDGSMLFIQNLISKLEDPINGGGRGAIVLSGSPLFNGAAGSGESEIRRWILENDLLEAIVALPTNIFFRTSIGTYVWLLSNRKPENRKGKVQLIDATSMSTSMRKNQGGKNKFISEENIAEVTKIYVDFEESPVSKIFDSTVFGYRKVKVLRPLRVKFEVTPEKVEAFKDTKGFKALSEDTQSKVIEYLEDQYSEVKDQKWFKVELADAIKKLVGKVGKDLNAALFDSFSERNEEAEIYRDDKGNAVVDSELTDYENIPLSEDIDAYMEREVLPHAHDAYIDTKYKDEKDGQVGVVGYEINFNRYFYKFEQPRHPNETLAEIKELSAEVAQLLGEI